jgi:hypothetical protein
MKSKSKVILGLAAVLAGTVGVAAVSTFAWFTTQNSAQLAFAHAYIKANNANILVTYDDSVPGNGINATDDVTAVGNGFSVSSTVDVTDISGDGINFYRPVWQDFNATPKVASGISSYTAIGGHYVKFGATITNQNTNQGVYVYMGSGSTIEGNTSDSKDADAAKASRLAVVDPAGDSGNGSLISYWQAAKVDGRDYQYLAAGTAGADSAYSVDGYKLVTCSVANLPTWRLGSFSNPATNKYTADDAARDANDVVDAARAVGDGQTVCYLPESGTKTVDFVMWVEGTNLEATDSIIDHSIKFNVELFAITDSTDVGH